MPCHRRAQLHSAVLVQLCHCHCSSLPLRGTLPQCVQSQRPRYRCLRAALATGQRTGSPLVLTSAATAAEEYTVTCGRTKGITRMYCQIGRKALFAGKDYIAMVKLIVNVLGE